MHKLSFLALIFSADAVRVRHKRRDQSDSWTTTADRAHGPCAPYLVRGKSGVLTGRDNLPVAMPLICNGEATGIYFSATAYGHTNAVLRMELDGKEIGSKSYPWWQVGQDKTLTGKIGALSSGLHFVRFTGSKIDFKNVTLQGNGGSCSFDEAAGWDQAQSMATYTALDAYNRLFGPSRDFSSVAKKQLYFASESVGKSEDGEISAKIVQEGLWNWLLSYSQNSSQRDSWGGDWRNLWDEARNYPHTELSLEYVPGRSGQKMTVYESCNSLSNIGFAEVAVWLSCKAYPFTRDEHASIVSAFSGLAAGSSFLHSCGCRIGNRTDTFTMDWLLLQSYQIMVKKTMEFAGDKLTEDERNAVLNLVPRGKPPVMAVDVAKDMTRLLAGKYDRDFFNATVFEYNIPDYMVPIGAVIAFTSYALEQNSIIPFLQPIFDSIFDVLLSLFYTDELQEYADWLVDVYIPAAKKALRNVKFCRAVYVGVDPLVIVFLKFAVTFIEALLYQENVIPTPPILQTLLDILEGFGVTSDQLASVHRTWDIYNGEDCLSRSQHAVWHHRAGHGLVFLLDMAEIFMERTKPSKDEC